MEGTCRWTAFRCLGAPLLAAGAVRLHAGGLDLRVWVLVPAGFGGEMPAAAGWPTSRHDGAWRTDAAAAGVPLSLHGSTGIVMPTSTPLAPGPHHQSAAAAQPTPHCGSIEVIYFGCWLLAGAGCGV